jgi:hypothetical protein
VTVPQARDRISIAYIQKQLPTIGDKHDHGKVQERDNGGFPTIWVHVLSWFFFVFFIRLWRRTEGDDYETGDGLAQGSNYFQN